MTKTERELDRLYWALTNSAEDLQRFCHSDRMEDLTNFLLNIDYADLESAAKYLWQLQDLQE